MIINITNLRVVYFWIFINQELYIPTDLNYIPFQSEFLIGDIITVAKPGAIGQFNETTSGNTVPQFNSDNIFSPSQSGDIFILGDGNPVRFTRFSVFLQSKCLRIGEYIWSAFYKIQIATNIMI